MAKYFVGGDSHDIVRDMASIFATLFTALYLASTQITRREASNPSKSSRVGTRKSTQEGEIANGSDGSKQFAPCQWLAPQGTSKRSAELLCIRLSVLWIGCTIFVIAGQAYEFWGKWGYLLYCGGCAALFLVVPLAWPAESDRKLPLGDRYILKANLWIAIFGFIGNYWYTHYFYHVLKAKYTLEVHRLNDVPIAFYLMTHAYFMFYHVLSNMALRAIHSSYEPDTWRAVYKWIAVVVLSYSTAFMESLTICAFPYYTFDDRHMAYTLGSAFYGIYFLVSFPAFFTVDEVLEPSGHSPSRDKKRKASMFDCCVESLASGMAVLLLLDFCRLGLGVQLFANY